jgi:hypothetical protein
MRLQQLISKRPKPLLRAWILFPKPESILRLIGSP